MLNAVALLLGSAWALYAFYVFSMAVYRAWLSKRLAGLSLVLLSPFVLLAAVVDLCVNCTLACIVFAELPREPLVTQRLRRYHGMGQGWRFEIAAYVCDRLLDVFDPTGDHC